MEEGYYTERMLQKNVYPRMLFDYSLNRSSVIASLCNKIIKKEILQKAISKISNDLSYGEDAVSAYLCLLDASAAYFCNRTFYHYRDNPVSLTHVNTSVMEKRIFALDREMRHQFSSYEAVMSNQIDGHITRHAVEQVRSVLLYATDQSFSERCRIARAFSTQPQIVTALKNAFPKIQDKKEKVKVLLILTKQFRLLFFLFRKV